MRYTLTEIEGRVYALLDENREIIEERVEYGDPGTALSPLIRELLPDAARIVLSVARASDIDECRHMGGGTGVIATADDRAELELPAGFLRLLYFRMSDWKSGVDTPMAFGSETHRLRRGGYIRGSRRRYSPAVAIRTCGENRTLEIFGTGDGATVAEFGYLTVPSIIQDAIDIPPGVYGAVCDKLVEMVRLVLER